ncbi:37S ribosomal YMR [Hyphodiscus hymeniophilus]|uniref:37S ribosomal YMR n=1 Tax=Hyphodiscus hymeniophilus TaxID=353542 RepID=A0A9P7B087_9HELO|nr:37S ribosomal YMR [Hyphodiscus hymeniophilus]
MFATKALRQASAGAERAPMIKFLGKRTIPSSIDHAPHAHPASPTHKLPEGFGSSSSSSTSFSSYRQTAQQHGPLGNSAGKSSGILGAQSGHSLGPVTPAKGEYFDRSELPERFRRVPMSAWEMEVIDSGGASLSD